MLATTAGCETLSAISPVKGGNGGSQGASGKAELDAEFAPNPKRLGPFKATGQTWLQDIGVKTRSCNNGYIPNQPSLVVDVPEQLDKVKLTATDGDLLYIRHPDDTYHCIQTQSIGRVPSLTTKWVEGRHEVYIGVRRSDSTTEAELVFEDLARPLALEWMTADIPTLEMNGSIDGRQSFTREYSPEENKARSEEWGARRCGGIDAPKYAKKPDLRLEVKKETSFSLGAHSPTDGGVSLIGPMPEDNRDIPSDCIGADEQTRTLEPGTYFLRMGYHEIEDAPPLVHYVVDVPEPEDRPRLATVETIPEALTIPNRIVTLHFPFLELHHIEQSDRLRKELLLKAPRQLFVAPSRGLDKQTAQVDIKPYESNKNELLDSDPTFSYPQKGEPMLLIKVGNTRKSGKVLAADGSIYDVEFDDLVPIAEVESPKLPEDVRNPQVRYDHAQALAGEDDQPLLDRRDERHERFDDCFNKVWEPVEPKLEKLKRYPSHNKEEIDRIERETREKANRECGLGEVRAQDREMWKQLKKNRTERRREFLGEVTERLEKLFGDK